jgi:hypothetical protein
MASRDEYCIDVNPEGWEDAKAEALASVGNDLDQWRIVEVLISEDALNAAFAVPVLTGGLVTEAGER